MLIKYIKSVLWRVAKRLSYIEDAWCLKVNVVVFAYRILNGEKLLSVIGIINKPLLMHLVGCLYYLYQWYTVKQISVNEIYLLIKYIKSVLWRVAKRLSYIEDARGLKVNVVVFAYRILNGEQLLSVTVRRLIMQLDVEI